MALSFVYRLARRIVEALSVNRMDAVAQDAESPVLRHQLSVLRRQVDRPALEVPDRAVPARLAQLLFRRRIALSISVRRPRSARLRRHSTTSTPPGYEEPTA